MSDLRMFRMGKKVEELASSRFDLEKKLQNLLEENMQTVFGVRFLASEYVIDQGRMDSLGIDENKELEHIRVNRQRILSHRRKTIRRRQMTTYIKHFLLHALTTNH